MNVLKSGQLLCVQCDDLPLKPSTVGPGVFVKDVAVTDGLEMQIVRLERGAQLPLICYRFWKHESRRPYSICLGTASCTVSSIGRASDS